MSLPTQRTILRAVAAICALAALSACGGDDPKPAADTAAGGADTATGGDATQDAALDSAKADTGGGGGSDTAPADTGAVDVATADLPVGKKCSALWGCAGKCLSDADPAPCLAACAKDGTPDAKAKIDAIGACMTKDCKGLGAGVPVFACAAEKCFDTLAACGDWSGSSGCGLATGCIARCTFNDDACRLACLPKIGKAEAGKFGALLGCGADKCGKLASADEMATCLADKCAAPLGACKGAGWDCTQLAACLGKCPPPTPNKPNACAQTCKLLGSADGIAKEQKLTACKGDCAGAFDKTACIAQKCSADRVACFVDDGKDSCNLIFKCVIDTCEGIGGDAACIAKCLAKGTAVAKDGWVYYEGCMTQQLDSEQGALANCSFPYNLDTCIKKLEGFCSAQTTACFKPQ